MNRYVPITFSAIFLLMAFIPCQVLAASITEDRAAIGKGCTASGSGSTAMDYITTASGDYSTAMGYNTTASGDASTAMGFSTTASGSGSTAMGANSTASGQYSFAGGHYMQLSDAADHTFVWGYSTSVQSITTANAFLIFPAGTAGKVGIGTKIPSEKLDVVGHIKVEGDGGWNSTGDEAIVGLGSVLGHFFIKAVYGDGLKLGAYNVTDAFVLKEVSGNIGIGTANPSYKLHVNGSVAGTSWNNISSRDFKEAIQKVSETDHPIMLTKLMNMNLTTYKYKEEYGGDGTTKLGFIAEDMPEEVLSKDGKGVDVYELLTLTIGAMKAQQRENEILKANLAEVMARLEALEK